MTTLLIETGAPLVTESGAPILTEAPVVVTPSPPWTAPASTVPTPHLEISWDAPVSVATDDLDWTDFTTGLRDVSADMGRQRELDTVDPGNFTASIDDPNRLFDRTNDDNPYQDAMRPLARVNYSETWADKVYPQFTGFLRSANHTRPSLNERVANLSAVDMFTVLNQVPMASCPYDVEVMADDPMHMYRIGSGLRLLSDSGHHPGSGEGFFVTSAQDLAAGGTGNSATFDGQSSFVWLRGATLAGPPWTIAVPLLINGADVGPGYQTLYSQHLDAIHVRLHGTTTSPIPGGVGGYPAFGVTAPGAVWSDTIANRSVADGRPHVLHCVHTGTAISLYLDGVLVDTAAAGPNHPGGPVSVGSYGLNTPPVNPFKGQIGDISVWDSVLPADRIAAQADAFLTGWADDWPGQRINRLLDHAGVPAVDRDVSILAGVCRLGPAALDKKVLPNCLATADADGGIFFSSAEKPYSFYGREYLVVNPRSNTSQATFTDVPGGGVAYDLPLEVPLDDAQLWNRATVTRPGGSSQSANDLVAQARDLVREAPSRDGSLYANDQEALSAAHRLLARSNADPIHTLTVQPGRDPDVLYPLVLGLKEWDRITYVDRSGYSTDLIIEGISWKRRAIGHKVYDFAVSGARDVSDYLILDNADSPRIGAGRIL